MADRDGTAPQRERSRGRSETRSRRSPEAQGVDTSRIERLETQVARLSDSLISLGPALQQVIQLSSNPNFVAQNVAAPTVLPGSQMPIPPAQVPQNPAPGLAQPDPTAQPSDLGNPTNVNADPLQTSDPWRNYTSPSREAGIPERPFPTSLPASPDRQFPPFGASQLN